MQVINFSIFLTFEMPLSFLVLHFERPNIANIEKDNYM